MELIEGRCWTCGDDVTVYQIIPECRWTMKKIDGELMGNWIFETMEPGIKNVEGGFKALNYSIIIAGKDFGCGSKSVEHPMAALKGAGIKLVLAESVSRYSFRNAINLALPVLICPNITKKIHRDDEICVDPLNGLIRNITTGEVLKVERLSQFAIDIISSGGLLGYIMKGRKYCEK